MQGALVYKVDKERLESLKKKNKISVHQNIPVPAIEERIAFSIDVPEFDESTYIGRYKSFTKTCNPVNALYSRSKILQM